MVDVFISYPRAARAKVELIKAKLDAIGLDCFFDVDGIDGGAEFPVVIDRAVKSAKAVLGCWSTHAFSRPWVIQECRVARARNVLVPVAIERFDDLDVPTEFFGLNWLDLVGWDGGDEHENWTRTLAALSKLVGRELAPPRKALRQGNETEHAPQRLAPPTSLVKLVQTFNGHSSTICGAAFSPDGRRLLTCSYDCSTRLWDVASGQTLRVFPEENSLYDVACAPDGRLMMTGSGDNTAKIWEIETGNLVRVLKGHDVTGRGSGVVYSVEFSSDGRLVLTGAQDNTAKVWDARSGRTLKTLSGHTDFLC